MSETSNTTNYGPMEPRLYLAFELGKTDWTLGFTIGLGQAPRRRKIKEGDLIGIWTARGWRTWWWTQPVSRSTGEPNGPRRTSWT